MSARPLIAHVLYRLDTGGMEQMLVSLINHTHDRYRHLVICLQGYGALRDRIVSDEVPCVALNKKSGKDWPCYLRLWRTLRKWKPDLVHTYNFGALDATLVAKLACVRRVVHAERGRTAADPDGENRKYRLLRRCLLPFVDRYVTVSRDLRDWLIGTVGVPAARVVCIPNGIDTKVFSPATDSRAGRALPRSFAPPGTLLIGTVGRLDAVKDQAGLIHAFHLLCEAAPDGREPLRLAIAGEGGQRAALEAQVMRLGLSSQVRLLGNRADVPSLLREFDVFVLSSIAEGMPGVVLEAMASGLPVVATAVGGVGEVVLDGVTGTLVPARDPQALADALAVYASREELRKRQGAAGRARATATFSLQAMLSGYVNLYDTLLDRDRGHRRDASAAPAATNQQGH